MTNGGPCCACPPRGGISCWSQMIEIGCCLHMWSCEFFVSSNGPVVPAAECRRLWSNIRENPKCLVNNLALCYFIHHGSHMKYPGIYSGLPQRGPATKHLSNGTMLVIVGMQLTKSMELSPWEVAQKLKNFQNFYETQRFDRIPMRLLDIFNWPNISSRIMDLGSTQPLTEMSTGNILGYKGRPARRADNLTAIYEPIV
jgi:hypothetical protein